MLSNSKTIKGKISGTLDRKQTGIIFTVVRWWTFHRKNLRKSTEKMHRVRKKLVTKYLTATFRSLQKLVKNFARLRAEANSNTYCKTCAPYKSTTMPTLVNIHANMPNMQIVCKLGHPHCLVSSQSESEQFVRRSIAFHHLSVIKKCKQKCVNTLIACFIHIWQS